MIRSLAIRDFAIVESLSIEFSSGFNVITGETGAGKSILIRALNLLMGGKASPDYVRSGSETATVTGEFFVPVDHPAALALIRLGIPYETGEDDTTLFLRRQISTKGRSAAWINDVSVTTQCLKDVGTTLVDVFGQHENQKLLIPSEHIRYIDLCANDRKIHELVKTLSGRCTSSLSRILALMEKMNSANRNQDYLQFRADELEKFSPTKEDYESLNQLCKLAETGVHLKESLSSAASILEDEEQSLSNRMRVVAKSLQKSGKQTLSEQAQEISSRIEELSFEVNRELSTLDIDEGELDAAQKRLYDYQDLFRKYAVKSIEALLPKIEEQQKELTLLETGVSEIGDLLKEIEKTCSELEKASAKLTSIRKTAATQVKSHVETELHELSMPGSRFSVEWTPIDRPAPSLQLETLSAELEKVWQKIAPRLSKLSEEGGERCQFLLASNPGEPLLALAKVASGGELSRVMLALKKSLSVDAETCVLVFDEIDAGISGRVADVVGRKMRELANHFQVLCISHLPQVAVYADSHFLVEKVKKKTRTESSIRRLSKDESANEIARLLSGSEVSSSSLSHAKHLIKLAHGGKKPSKSEARIR